MLSLHAIPVQSARALAAYYEGLATHVDSYYQGGAGEIEPPGQWAGSGAAPLALNGVIREGELLRAMQGFHPKNTDALAHNAGKGHKPGWDLPCSAPKSVSAAWAVGDENMRNSIEDAQRAAVRRTLAYLEQNAITARMLQDQGAVRRDPVTLHGGAVFACYEHSSSRSGDPQLHTHAILLNMTPAGRAVDFNAAFVHAGGAIYRSELAYRLRELGFAIERDGKSFRLAGSPQELLDTWSKRRAQIEAEAAARGVHSAKGLETVTLATRAAKDAQPRSSLFAQWTSEAREYGYNVSAVHDQAKRGLQQTFEAAPETGLLAELTQTRATMSREQALVELAARTYGQDNANGLEARLTCTLEEQAVVLRSPEIRSEWHRAGVRYTTEEMLKLEQQLIARCERLAADREAFHLSDYSRRAALQRTTLTEEQRRAFNRALDSGRTTAIQGAAGTGKSTLLGAVREAYEVEGYRVLGTALSQRATRGLEEASGIQSHNVARLLYDLENGSDQLDARTILVVDEAGMLGTRQLNNLTRHAENVGAKVILVGDSRQLQAIEAGGAFRGIQERIGYAELIDNRRQLNLADREMVIAFREGRAAEGLEILHKHSRLYLHEDKEAVKQTAVLAYLQDFDAGKSSLLLAKDRYAVHELNEAVRAELKAENVLGQSEAAVLTTNGYRRLAEHDRVVLGLGAKQQFYNQLERQDREHAHNGACGTVERVAADRITVRLDTGQEVNLDAAGYLGKEGKHQGWAIDHGYSATVHKAQGMTVDRSHVVISGVEQREWAYVALSRHRESVHVYATHDALGADAESVERAEAVLQLDRAESKDLANDYQVNTRHPVPELEIT